jgi:ankyrin repeat protein
MSLTSLATLGWVLLGLDTLLLVLFFMAFTSQSDAAGRLIATGFSVVCAPAIILAAAALWWAQSRSSFSGILAATLVAAFPFLLFGGIYVTNQWSQWSYQNESARSSHFSDQRLTALSRAIAASDAAQSASILRTGPIDWSARNGGGKTILGVAVEKAIYGTASDLEVLKALIAAGARYQEDALGPSKKLLVEVANSGPQTTPLLALLLDAGANPNSIDEDNRPLLIRHDINLEKAQLLIARGAELKSIRDTRSDRLGWDALMNAAYIRDWPRALFYLRQGCDPNHKAADGQTLNDVLREVRHLNPNVESESGYAEFVKALGEQSANNAVVRHSK